MREVNEKLILTTSDFLRKYYDLHTDKSKMTFNELNEFLTSKKESNITKAGLKITSIKKEEVLKGNYVLVKFKGGKVTAINTPVKPFSLLQKELNKKSKKELEKLRLQVLDNQGYEEDVQGFIYEKENFPYEDYEEEKVKVRRNGKYKR